MLTARRRARRGTRAQTLAEFALVAPLLLLLLFGVIDFGWMVFNYNQLFNALREALRYGSVPGYDSTPQYIQCDAIRKQITDLANLSHIAASNITITYDDGRPATDDTYIVGTCPIGGSFTANAAYVPPGAVVAAPQTTVNSGNRIVINIDVNVPFLTPLIRTFASGGIRMQFQAARTIFPDGLGLNN